MMLWIMDAESRRTLEEADEFLDDNWVPRMVLGHEFTLLPCLFPHGYPNHKALHLLADMDESLLLSQDCPNVQDMQNRLFNLGFGPLPYFRRPGVAVFMSPTHRDHNGDQSTFRLGVVVAHKPNVHGCRCTAQHMTASRSTVCWWTSAENKCGAGTAASALTATTMPSWKTRKVAAADMCACSRTSAATSARFAAAWQCRMTACYLFGIGMQDNPFCEVLFEHSGDDADWGRTCRVQPDRACERALAVGSRLLLRATAIERIVPGFKFMVLRLSLLLQVECFVMFSVLCAEPASSQELQVARWCAG